MAGDWIKMRVWLRRDPKVIRMADLLAVDREFMNWLTDPVRRSCADSAYEHVTSDVTRALCVTSLLEVWGTAREQGQRVGEDLVLEKCSLSTLDDIAGIPGIGEAMRGVEWAQETESDQVVFPKFFADKQTPDERHRSTGAERQARYRDRRRNARDAEGVTGDVTGDAASNVTVTPREEKRRVEIKDPPNPPPKAAGESESDFARFWAAYPRKKSKGDAEKAWKKIRPGKELLGLILAAVDAQKRSLDWTKDGGRYIPYPASWLNSKGWEDEVGGGPRGREESAIDRARRQQAEREAADGRRPSPEQIEAMLSRRTTTPDEPEVLSEILDRMKHSTDGPKDQNGGPVR